jgi:hypothetical protein
MNQKIYQDKRLVNGAMDAIALKLSGHSFDAQDYMSVI